VSTPDPRDPYRPPAEPSPDGGRLDAARPEPSPSPPGEPPGGRLRPAPMKAPPDHPTARAARTALLIAITGVGMTIVLLPVGLVLDVAAVILGTRARRRARATGFRAPAAVAAIVLGLSCLGFVLAVLAILGPQLSRYSSCMGAANTEIARQNCENAFVREVEQRFGVDIPQGTG
jgi:hypothetical protein